MTAIPDSSMAIRTHTAPRDATVEATRNVPLWYPASLLSVGATKTELLECSVRLVLGPAYRNMTEALSLRRRDEGPRSKGKQAWPIAVSRVTSAIRHAHCGREMLAWNMVASCKRRAFAGTIILTWLTASCRWHLGQKKLLRPLRKLPLRGKDWTTGEGTETS